MAIQDRYALLRRVVRIANSHSLSYFSRLRSVARLLANKLSAESVTIYLLDEDRKHLSSFISSMGTGKPSRCYIPLGEGIAGLPAATHSPALSGPEKLFPGEACTGKESLFLALPLIDCGVISFGHCSGPTHPQPLYSEDLKDLLIPVEGLLQRINLSEGSARRVRNLTRVGEIGQLLNRPVPPREMIELILDGCIRHGDACCVIIRLLEEKGLPAGVYKRSRSISSLQISQILSCEESFWPAVVENAVPLLACDLIAEGEFPRSYVSVPLHFKTKVVGTLTFFGKKGSKGYCRNFNGEDRDTFENIGRLIANGIAETVNYEKLVLVSQKNDKKVRELSLLHNISNAMLSTIRLNRLIHLTLTTLVSGSQSFFERAMLFLINERAGVMQGMFGISRENVGMPSISFNVTGIFGTRREVEAEISRQQESEFCRKVMATRLELNDPRNICSRAVQGRKVVLVSDSLREKRLDQDFVRRFDLSSFAVAPLMAKEQVVGVVIVDNPLQNRPISEEDLHFLQLFTNQAGMAIENSMLYNRLEEANRSLCDARERLVHSARLATIGEMSATIAHELKGPLVAIGGFARRLEKKVPSASSESVCVATIIREVQRLEKMLTDILSYAKKTTICYTSCCITEIIEDALAIVTPALDDKDIVVAKHYPRKNISFLGDAQQLKQVFINLFLNSQEAMSHGGRLEIGVGSAKMEGTHAVSITVVDSGGGIPQEIINQIFTPFYTTKDSGTGLGLPIANRIIKNHGGTIQVKNRGTGAEFNILLPLVG